MGVESLWKQMRRDRLEKINEETLDENKRPRFEDVKKVYQDVYNELYDMKIADADICYTANKGEEGDEPISVYTVYVEWPSDGDKEEDESNKQELCDALKEYKFRPFKSKAHKNTLRSYTSLITDYDLQELRDKLEDAGFIDYNDVGSPRTTKDNEEVNESEALNKKANDYLEKKGYHNYLNGDYDKNRLALKMIKEKKEVKQKADEEQFAKFVQQLNESSEDDAREGYDYNGHTIQLDNTDDQWVVDDDENLRFISQQGAEDFIDELESLEEDPDAEATEGSDPEEEPTGGDEELKIQHVYWDKDHENAVYIIDIYPEDNKVIYYTDDNQRRETTIDNFKSKYEPSTNSDDYEIFEEKKLNK